MKQKGMSLLELILFIVIIGIVARSLLIGMNNVLLTTDVPSQLTNASFLANARMQIILMNLTVNGYSTATLDPCTVSGLLTTNICAPYVGASTPTPAITGYQTTNHYTVTSSSSGSNPKTITVTVTGAGNATVTASVYNYANN